MTQEEEEAEEVLQEEQEEEQEGQEGPEVLMVSGAREMMKMKTLLRWPMITPEPA